jgi:hypothetical protein
VLSRFVDDDFGYLQWLRDRPGTFVLDTERRPSRSFVVVHRTTCSTISGPTRSGGWTTRQIKVCGTTYEEIEDWCQYNVGVHPTRCHLCKPVSTAGGGEPQAPASDPAIPRGMSQQEPPGAASNGAEATGGDGTPAAPKGSRGRARATASPKAASAAKPAAAKAATTKPSTAKAAPTKASSAAKPAAEKRARTR